MRYFIFLAYDGTEYHGWQYQPNAMSVQQRLQEALSVLLDGDVSCVGAGRTDTGVHARFSALSRRYRYYISLRKDPFNVRYVARMYYTLDFDVMNRAAALLLRYDDFGSFCKAHSDNKTNICHVTQAIWMRQDEDVYCFEITADRFLRNMVRAIVGTLLDVGRGKITLGQFEEVIQSGDRCVAGDSVPAQGLFLEEISYPQDIFI